MLEWLTSSDAPTLLVAVFGDCFIVKRPQWSKMNTPDGKSWRADIRLVIHCYSFH